MRISRVRVDRSELWFRRWPELSPVGLHDLVKVILAYLLAVLVVVHSLLAVAVNHTAAQQADSLDSNVLLASGLFDELEVLCGVGIVRWSHLWYENNIDVTG